MNNTVEYWEIDDVSLHQYGWSCVTVGGSRYGLPARRGENITLAYSAGARWRPKQTEQHPISLAMFLTGMDPATGNSTGDQVLRWNDSWDFLRRLVWRVEGRQFILRRRQRLTIDGYETILVTEALAEMTGTMEPTMTGRSRADFVIDLLLADPYFYGNQVTVPLPKNTPTGVNNPGFDVSAQNHCRITFTGPLTKPKITNATADPDLWVRYNGTVATGATLILDVGQYTASMSDWSINSNVVGDVAFSGSRRWMELLPKGNLLTLTADSGTGSASIQFRPPYL